MASHFGSLVVAALAACATPATPAPIPAKPSPTVASGLEIAESEAVGMVEGPSTARLTVVEAFDYACPHCTDMQPAIDELVRAYGGKVRVVYKHFVLHAEKSDTAHLASCAAAKQGKFRAFGDALRTEIGKRSLTDAELAKLVESGDVRAMTRSPVEDVDLLALGRGLGLDVPRFEADRHGQPCRAFLDRDRAELAKLGVDHLPMFFIGHDPVDTSSKAELQAAIDRALVALP